MITYYINSVDISSSVEVNTLTITEQIQRRATSASFIMLDNKPTDYQDAQIYDHVSVSSYSGTTLIIKDNTCSGESVWKNNFFYIGQTIIIGIGESTQEEVTIASFDSSTNTITLSAAAISAHSEDEKVGVRIFGGTIAGVSDENLDILTNLIYRVECIDYTKIFDKRLLNEAHEDRNSLYIINDSINDFVNLNILIDDMDYTDNAAIQAEWIEGDDGDNPTIDASDFKETNKSGVFPWTFSGGTAAFTSTPSSLDFSDLSGVASGTPSEGVFAFWYKQSDNTAITSIEFRIGSSASDYTALTFVPTSDDDWNYKRINLIDGSETGTPDWTSIDYLQINITQTADANIRFDGIRINETGSFTFDGVEDGTMADNFNISFKKPSLIMERLANRENFYWYIDYDKDVKFYNAVNKLSPFSLNNTSNNFNNLNIEIDTSQLINRQITRGGLAVSTSTFEQDIAGDGQSRVFLLKSKFKNMAIWVDDNGTTDTMEAGTTITSITATAHGLAVGDFITNRDRENVTREVLTVPTANTFTVAAVTGQTNGDTFSIFSTKTVGIEFLVDEATVDYVSNFNEKSIKATDSEATLTTDGIIKFQYNEMFNVLVQAQDNASITSMTNLIGGDGIFEGDPIVDSSIKTLTEGQDRSKAQLTKYSNALINASFTTDKHGLRAGQTLNIIDSNRSLNSNFLIQTMTRQIRNSDYSVFSIQCSSTLFGIVELFQKLLDKNITDSENEDVETLENVDETISISDASSSSLDDPTKTWGVDANNGIWSQFQWS